MKIIFLLDNLQKKKKNTLNFFKIDISENVMLILIKYCIYSVSSHFVILFILDNVVFLIFLQFSFIREIFRESYFFYNSINQTRLIAILNNQIKCESYK